MWNFLTFQLISFSFLASYCMLLHLPLWELEILFDKFSGQNHVALMYAKLFFMVAITYHMIKYICIVCQLYQNAYEQILIFLAPWDESFDTQIL